MRHGPAEVVASLDNMITTNQRGAIAECAITAEAIRLGVGVFRAVADERYDFVLDIGACLLRVQCKTAALNGDVLVIRCYSCRRTAGGMLKRSYTSDEIDAVAAYCDELDRCFLIPIHRVDALSTIQLRLVRAKNNQARRINWAKDFEFADTLSRYGAIAQLGERLRGTQEVAGSIPAGSTHQPSSAGGGSGPQMTPRPAGPPTGERVETAEQR